ncbi:MAG: LD-carboxypeptidase [Clostridia bacterium]|nr:LD-carboxypeptidase [Clostridia bacterium]
MNKVKRVKIVSLSSGSIGESYAKFEVDIGLKRLEEFGLDITFAKNARAGKKYLNEHPEKRADDLIEAFSDKETDMILCAIGGDDTYRLTPYLLDNDRLKNVLCDKIFLGFSDTTINHFLLHKLGLNTFYGQSFLADLCEMEPEMLPYSEKYFKELIHTGTIGMITPSDLWYEERESFLPEDVGTKRKAHKNGGFELLNGSPVFSGKILGGCIESMLDMFDPGRYTDMPAVCERYGLFPDVDGWRGKILLLESSEETPHPQVYERAVSILKSKGVFSVISGIIMGKPMNDMYHKEYKTIIKNAVQGTDVSVLANVSIGHAAPRCIIPFGVDAKIDADKQIITFG